MYASTDDVEGDVLGVCGYEVAVAALLQESVDARFAVADTMKAPLPSAALLSQGGTARPRPTGAVAFATSPGKGCFQHPV